MGRLSFASYSALALALAPACANYSQLQDAETLRAGETRVGIGASFTRYDSEATNSSGQTVNESVSVPAVVISARRGLTDRLEAQTTAWLPLGARIGLKYQLLGETGKTGFHVSLGGHVGYLKISASSGDEEASATMVDAYLPLYLGYRVSPAFAVYAAPQYMLRSAFGSGDSEYGHVGGSTLGIAIGERSKFHLEAGAFYDTLVEAPIFNTAFGISL
ncbi:MAG: hypothetical protein ACTHU0_36215 [Kofleriaceae bacterium]